MSLFSTLRRLFIGESKNPIRAKPLARSTRSTSTSGTYRGLGLSSSTGSTGNNKVLRWAAVSLIPGERACPIVKEYRGRRWLTQDAPRFPLPGCAADQCNCRYRHHADRRGQGRRQIDRFGTPRHFTGEDHRGPNRGRRSSDIL